MAPGDAQRSRWRDPLAVAAALCFVLAAVGLGWMPLFDRAWAFNLWQYLPGPVAVALAAAVAVLPWRPMRERCLRAASIGATAAVRLPRPAWIPILAAAFWLLRERQRYGDSNILLYTAGGSNFLFPDIGATFLFHLAHEFGDASGVGAVAATQLCVCVAGAFAALGMVRLGAELAPTRDRAAVAAALLLCGGLSRIFFGHVEVYAFVVLCGSVYLWTACAFLNGRGGWLAPSLALGAGLWMHLSFVFLLPAHAVMLASTVPRSGARRVAASLACICLPTLGFLLAMAAAGRQDELALARQTLVQMAGWSPDPHAHESWVRTPFEEPGPGTKYVLFSLPHLKYLANAFYLLAPAVGPLLAGFALTRPRALTRSADARFLAAAAAAMSVYAAIVRPVWGPYDWDVFSLTALCWGALVARLLVHELDDRIRPQLAAVAVCASLLLVTAPFVAIGLAPFRPAGLFAEGNLELRPGETDWEAFERRIRPWL